jgi:D-alanyl-D-alanine carboxypeptidase
VLPRGLATALGTAVLAASTLLGVSLAEPQRAAGMGPLPACRYDDILTEPRGYDDWAITLVDTILRVPATYAPPDLVSVSQAGIGGSGRIRQVAIDDLHALAAAAKAAGKPVAVLSAYRSYATQTRIYDGYVQELGEAQARLISARPGHSEHQLGLAIDFKTAGAGSPFGGDWGKTPAGRWMRRHAWQYGWLLSYPKGERSKTCYEYEPWHYRYVGRELAAEIHASGLTTREYLWANDTTAVVSSASASPGASGTASPGPSGSPTASASLEPSPVASPVESPDAASPSPLASPSAMPTDAPTPSPAATPPPSPGGLDSASLAAGIGLVIGLAVVLGAIALRRRRRPAA